ncbi:MAG: inorganic diphosphatase [Bacteroidota bacterium]
MSQLTYVFTITILIFITWGCKETIIKEYVPPINSEFATEDFDAIPAFSENQMLRAVIEIPAGTNLKIEYDKTLQKFVPDQIDGKNRIVGYLPYPGNYGFIPSTFMKPSAGGDGDALDVLVISEAVPTGTVMEILPIAMFGMTDEGEVDNKIIAIPADSTLQTLKVKDYQDLNTNELKAKFIVQYWFESYKKDAIIENIQWHNTPATIHEINKWLVR